MARDDGRDGGGRVSEPGGRPDPRSDPRALVLSVLHAVQREGRSTVVALDRALRPVLAGPERSFVTDVVYGTLRWLPTLDAALAARLPDPDALPERVRDALRAGTYERLVRGTPDHAAVHAWVDAVKRAGGPGVRLAGLVNAVLRRVDLTDAETCDGAAVGLPSALWQHLHAALGDRAAAAARAMLRPEPVWLTAYADDAAERLRAEGAEVRPGPLPGSWAVRPRRPLGELEAFRNGAVQPQNPASAAVVAALGEVAGRTVLDVGSGHGVKAAQLAAAGARVIAVELDERRAEAGRRNLSRLGLTAEHRVADATQPLDDVPLVDLALLDAPCTGTGTLRGHPEIKLRWRPEDAAAAAARQSAMLRTVAERVRPGGRLLYAVCALGLDEGPGVVAGFLADTPAWRVVAPALPLPAVAAPVGHWLLPDASGLDGFYLALLERERSPDEPPSGGSARPFVAGAGMMTGGRILHHLQHHLGDARNSLVVVGFQALGTLGRRIVDGARRVRVLGETIAVAAEVHTINGFSAHADGPALDAWWMASGAEVVVPVHGEAWARGSLAQRVAASGRRPRAARLGVDLTL